MALEALSSNELLNFIMYDSGIASFINGSSESSPPLEIGSCSSIAPPPAPLPPAPPETAIPEAVQPAPGRKKRRRRPKVCKNKEEAETQRMTHIAVERNRRKQMNEHLAVLRSLMPESYVQRGDQASIVGGAIDFVKELEHILQSLEAKKFALLGGPNAGIGPDGKPVFGGPFARFFSNPQIKCSHNYPLGGKYACQLAKAAVADIEVTLIETHANVRILSRRGAHQLSRLVAAFHSVLLTVLHLNVTTFDSIVLYSISAKVEEGCQLSTADGIAGAVHHMLRMMEEEEALGLNVLAAE